MTSRFLPFLRFYLFVHYPLAKPTAMVLDAWLGNTKRPHQSLDDATPDQAYFTTLLLRAAA